MPDMEIDFPRGGTLASIASTQKAATKRKKPDDATKDTKTKKSRVDAEYENVFTKYVSRDLLTEDVRALGVVKKIKETEVILEATNGLKVRLDARLISTEFTTRLGETSLDEVFQVGQIIGFKVIKAAKQKNEEPTVTTDPIALNCHLVPAAFKNALVINGSVSSIEDKGAVINIGLSKISGFVKNEDLPAQWKLDRLRIGQVLMFRVRRTDSRSQQRVIELSAFAEMDTYSDEKMSLSDLMPGTILTVEPDKATQSGVFGSLMNGEKVYINKSYLPPRIRLDPSRFVKPIRAVVICLLPNSPIFVLSAHPDTVALSRIERRQLPEEHRTGQNLKCTVYDVDKAGNVYLTLGEHTDKPPSLTALMMKGNFENYEEEISGFKIGSTHECRAVAYRALDRVLVVSTKRDVMKQKISELTDAKPGEVISGVVQKIVDKGLVLKLGTSVENNSSLLGFVPQQHALDRVRVKWKRCFEVGQRLKCRVLYVDEEKNRLYLTTKPSMVNSILPALNELTRSFEGNMVTGMAINPFKSGAFLIQFYNRLSGFLPADEAKKLHDLKEGDVVKARVVSVDIEKQRILLTLREEDEAIVTRTAQPVQNEKMIAVKKPAKPFQVCQARVLGAWKYGKTSPFTTAELRLPGGSIGRLHVSELDVNDYADGSSPMIDFLDKNQGRQVEVKVICVGKNKSITVDGRNALVKKCGTSRFVECTAKKNKIAEPVKKLRYIDVTTSFDRGDKVPMFIGDSSKMMKEGMGYASAEINSLLFARIPRLYIDLSNNGTLSEECLAATEDPSFKFSNGELRRGLVISQQRTSRVKIVNVALGDCILKEEIDRSQGNMSSKRDRRGSQRSNTEDEEDDEEVKFFEKRVQDPGFDFSLGMFSMANLAKVGKNSNKPTVEEENEDSEDDDPIKDEPKDDDEETLLRRERRIAEREARLSEAIPENPSDFDRLLTASVNSSDLWIKYITYFLRDDNVKEARRITERALVSINFREEAELFNIWTAYLNLEVMYGDAASLKAVFDRAVLATDSLKMHKQMVKILAHHKKEEQLDELFENMIRKFRREDLDVWFQYGAHLYGSERLEDARQLLQKALTSLNRKHHLSVLTRFAQMEYVSGDKERAKTMFEKVLQTYPKKTDIWSVYVDLSLKHEGIVEARRLLKRAIDAELGTYRTRIVYDKWTKAEERFGDEESLKLVQESAKEFMDKRSTEDNGEDGGEE